MNDRRVDIEGVRLVLASIDPPAFAPNFHLHPPSPFIPFSMTRRTVTHITRAGASENMSTPPDHTLRTAYRERGNMETVMDRLKYFFDNAPESPESEEVCV